MRFFLIISFLFLLNLSYSQNPYYDAIFLSDHAIMHKGSLYIKLDVIKRISDHLLNYISDADVRRYKGDMSDTEIAGLLRQTFDANPFFSVNAYMPNGKSRSERYSANGMKLDPSQVGGLSISTIPDEVSKVKLERVKQELSLAFFENFKKDLNKYPDLLTLFPYTQHALETIGTEISNFTAYIDILREAFLKDFQLIIPNFRNIVENPVYKDYFDQTPQLYAIMQVAFQIVDDYESEVHPGDIITHLAKMDNRILDAIDLNMKPSLQVLDIIVQSFRSQITDQYTVPYDSVRKNLLADSMAFRIYMGLVYQIAKYQKIKFDYGDSTINLCTLLDSAFIHEEKRSELLSAYKRLVESVMCSAEYVQQALSVSEREELADYKATYKDYFGFYYASLDLFRNISRIPDIMGNHTPYNLALGKSKNTCFFVIDKFSEIYLDINETRYASAILNTTSVYDTIFSEYNKRIFKTGNLILKYGNFGALITKAETSDQVKAALETAGLPAGSSRVKRESEFNVSLNAYIGGFYGSEKFTYAIDNETLTQRKPVAGLTAPVGIALSMSSEYPFGKRWRSSYTLLASVLDLGAFSSFRLKDTVNNIQPKITIENIFSPGLYLVYGVPNMPVFIGAGWQYGPALRKVETSVSITPKRFVKWCVFAGLDVPLWNIYSKPKR